MSADELFKLGDLPESRMKLYVLDDKGEPVIERNLMKWGVWFGTHNDECQVALDRVGSAVVSTIFMGIDTSLRWLRPDAAPILYETMVFGPEESLGGRRYSTRAEALTGHRECVDKLRIDPGHQTG